MNEIEQRVAEQAKTDARLVDVAVNDILLAGAEDETVSLHTARAAAAHQAWGCWFCQFLSVMVQRDHCTKTLDGEPMPALVYVRAGLCFAAFFYALHLTLAGAFGAAGAAVRHLSGV